MKISFAHFESVENDEPHTRDKWIDRALLFFLGGGEDEGNGWKVL